MRIFKEVFIHFFHFVGVGSLYAYAKLKHQLCQFVSVNQYDLMVCLFYLDYSAVIIR